MAKDKFRQRKIRRRKVKWAMDDLGIKGKEIAARLGITEGAVSKGLATSPRIVAALKEAGVPAKLFGKIPPSPPLEKGGESPEAQAGGS